MRTPSQRELLAVWEAGLRLAPPERAVELLRAAGTDEDPACLTAGQRDAGLLEMRERLFGPAIAATADCPKCGQTQEFEMRVEDVRTRHALASPGSAAAEFSLIRDGYSVTFRLPVSEDLAAVRGEDDESSMRAALLDRCILRAESAGVALTAAQLPDAVVEAVSARMAEADPQAEIELAIECSSCHFAWVELFDIVSFFWGEIHSWALRTLNEIHQLAAAYGWSEIEVLSVSPQRRSFYLELIAG
jgi:hypothetical protein